MLLLRTNVWPLLGLAIWVPVRHALLGMVSRPEGICNGV